MSKCVTSLIQVPSFNLINSGCRCFFMFVFHPCLPLDLNIHFLNIIFPVFFVSVSQDNINVKVLSALAITAVNLLIYRVTVTLSSPIPLHNVSCPTYLKATCIFFNLMEGCRYYNFIELQFNAPLLIMKFGQRKFIIYCLVP